MRLVAGRRMCRRLRSARGARPSAPFRLPAARAAKSDTDQDFKLLLEQLLADLLEAACLPEWPAASVLLLRFLTALNGPKGLQHTGAAAVCLWGPRRGLHWPARCTPAGMAHACIAYAADAQAQPCMYTLLSASPGAAVPASCRCASQ